MSKIRCKGTALQQQISSVYTTLSQVISLDGPNVEAETYDADTLDNTDPGILYEATGRVEGGSISGELFYDPALDSHQDYLQLLQNPAVKSGENWKILFADSGASTWTFAAAGHSFSPTVALNDGLKASFSIKLDGMPTFPAGGSAG